jgi:hypothetical protein
MDGVLLIFGLYSLVGLMAGILEVRRGNSQRLSKVFGLSGAFVYGDMIILGPFWLLVVAGLRVLDATSLFGFVYAVFWAVRSGGEVMYWLLEQFSERVRNPIETVPLNPFYRSEAAYYGMQVFWQCVLVVSLVAAWWMRPH